MRFWQSVYWGNSVEHYVYAVSIVLGILVILLLADKFIIHKLKDFTSKTKNKWDDILAETLDQVNPFVYVIISIYIGASFLSIKDSVERFLTFSFIVIMAFYVIQFFTRLVTLSGTEMLEKQRVKSPALAKFVTRLINVSLWFFAGILLVSNMGINVNSLIAGLGIGGIAIGLALQSVLSDMFSGISLILDKPFDEGDYVIIGTDDGFVKKVGIKSTRITTLRGEELILPNKSVAESKIQNFRKMKNRRMFFHIGVAYNTPVKKLEKIPQWIQEIVEKVEKTTFDRCPLKEMGSYSIMYEVVYFFGSREYAEALMAQQTIYLEILKKFEKENVVIAFPTQTIHVAK
jgi:small-conductance mechanosensitive channel